MGGIGSGRLSIYTPELADEICDLLAGGMTLRQVCRREGMPNEMTVRKWALDDCNGFYSQYTEARKIGYMAMADELVEIADDGTNDWVMREGVANYNGDAVARSRLRVDTRKWILSKALPKIFGDRVLSQHTFEKIERVEVTFVDALPAPDTIEGDAVEVDQ